MRRKDIRLLLLGVELWQSKGDVRLSLVARNQQRRLQVRCLENPRTSAQKTPRAFFLHRLIATAFLGPAPHPEHQVDHIDTDRGNNAAENLRWAASRENTTFALGVSVIQKTSDGGEIIARFASMSLAAEAVNGKRSSISRAVKHGTLCSDYRWEHA